MKFKTKTILYILLLILIIIIGYYTYPNNPEYVNYKSDLLAIEALEHNNLPVYFKYKDTPYTIKHDNIQSIVLAYAYAQYGNYARAIEITNQIKPKQKRRSYGRCISLDAPFRFPCAMFSKMISNNYYEIDKNYTLSYIYTIQENYEEALKLYQYSNTQDDCHEAFLHAKLNNNRLALKTLSKCKNKCQIDLVQGIINENKGCKSEAFNYYLKSIRCNNSNALLNLATKYKELGNQKEANKYAKMILKLHPYNKRALEIIQ